MTTFSGLSPLFCGRAFGLIEPAVLGAMEDGTLNKTAGFLVVLNPAIPYEPKYRNGATEGFVDNVVLWSNSIDPAHEKYELYRKVALWKAFQSWKTGLPSHRIQQEAPYLYEPGWTKWGGSAVGPGGLVVAFSGVQWYFDQMISEMMIAAIKSLCLAEMIPVMADADLAFFPTEEAVTSTA